MCYLEDRNTVARHKARTSIGVGTAILATTVAVMLGAIFIVMGYATAYARKRPIDVSMYQPTRIGYETPICARVRSGDELNEGYCIFLPLIARSSPQEQAEYLFSQLEQHDYGNLAAQLRELPQIQDGVSAEEVEALADITALAITASNREVREAFQLLLEGGTPNPSDLTYPVPSWNTELQVLYWLAKQNEFKRDDTLAQAIAMVNGIWVSMGTAEVRDAVCKDVNDLLNFFRETNEIQKARGYYQLEDYPLEALACLVDISNAGPMIGPSPYRLWQSYIVRGLRLDQSGYDWNTLSVETLRRMREVMDQRGWINRQPTETLTNLEFWFYFNVAPQHRTGSTNWQFVDWRTEPYPVDRGNVDNLFEQFLETNKGWGSCVEETELLRAFLQSWGIAANTLSWGHVYNYIFDHTSGKWKAYERQLEVLDWERPNPSMQDVATFYFYKPPIDQSRFLSYPDPDTVEDVWRDLDFYVLYGDLSFAEMKSRLSEIGIPTEDMKQLLLRNEYSIFLPHLTYRLPRWKNGYSIEGVRIDLEALARIQNCPETIIRISTSLVRQI